MKFWLGTYLKVILLGNNTEVMTYLKLPDDYVMSERLRNASVDTLVKIVNIGEFIYFDAHQTMTKDMFEQKYEQVKLNLEKEHLHALSMEATKTHSLVQINSNLQETIDNLRIDFDLMKTTMKETHSVQMRESYTQITSLQEQLNNVSTESQSTILSKMESLLGYGNTIDNIEKGNYGENYVNTHIVENFPESNLIDVSGTTASGDIIWELEENDFKCLVEVKNVAHGKNLNVDKFVRDVSQNSDQCIVNCGLFVSLKTENIPFKGKLKLEFVNNVPVIYVANVFKCPSALTYAMYMIKELQCYVSKFEKGSDCEEVTVNYMNAITIYFEKLKKDFNNHSSLIDDLKKNSDKIQVSISKLAKNMDTIMRDHVFQMRSYNINDTSNTPKVVSKEMCVDLIINYFKNRDRWPTGPESSISPYYRRVYKYSILMNEAKTKYESAL